MEKISIVVPTYNVAKYLDNFFRKLEEQTYQDFKVYIVYDESTDESLKIIERYHQQRPQKYEIIMSPKKDGLGAARDCALDSGAIVGDYVLFLDPDDYPESNFLERMITKALQTDADVVVCGFERFEDGTNKVLCKEMIHNPEEMVTNIADFDMLAYMNPVVWDKLYKRTCIESLRFTNIKRTEDVFWLMHMIPHIKSIAFVNEVLYHYRVRENSLLNTISEKAYEEVTQAFADVGMEMILCHKDDNEYTDLLNLIAFFRCGIGITYRTAVNDIRNTKKYVAHSRKILDKYFSKWQSNRFLKLSCCSKYGLKGWAIWGCKVLYSINAFPVYVYLYSTFQRVFKKEIRW
ncbi:MAG: glycosyltransferase family 2 protein [Lachnospiraceae bacterium]|nr:glycosyltransferase family 2 protein [Lachnospiraceae bacterium]